MSIRNLIIVELKAYARKIVLICFQLKTFIPCIFINESTYSSYYCIIRNIFKVKAERNIGGKKELSLISLHLLH